MRDRSEQILRCACLALAVLVLGSLLRAGCRAGALVGARIPPVPRLETNSVAGTNVVSGKGTNSAAVKPGNLTNVTHSARATNATDRITTNLVLAATNLMGTNLMAAGTNLVAAKKTMAAGTNVAAGKMTNVSNAADATNVTQLISTNLISVATNLMGTTLVAAGTNLVSKISRPAGTNSLSATDTDSADTNKPAKKTKKNSPSEMAAAGGMAGGSFPGRPGMPGQAPKLPPEIQARVDKIVESEMFAPVMHPQPMALLGIAGETVFLQTPSGQTGLLTMTNEPLDGIKLLRIGVNRVLVEQDGQKKELMIFEGYGGESLLPKEESKK